MSEIQSHLQELQALYARICRLLQLQSKKNKNFRLSKKRKQLLLQNIIDRSQK